MFEEGQIVISKRGRDKGNFFIIFKILSQDYVLIVDGKKHTLEKPKKKNIKHLQKVNKSTDILDKLNYKDLQGQNKKLSKIIQNLDISI